MTPDPRIVYGARCFWWDSIANVDKLPSGLPCCPICKGVLLEMDNETHWWEQVDRQEEKEPGYRRFIEWLRGRCFKSMAVARMTFERSLR